MAGRDADQGRLGKLLQRLRLRCEPSCEEIGKASHERASRDHVAETIAPGRPVGNHWPQRDTALGATVEALREEKIMSPTCDCEHHTHDPSGTGTPTEHPFGEGDGTVTVKTPWGGVFLVCKACFEAGHMQGTQFR